MSRPVRAVYVGADMYDSLSEFARFCQVPVGHAAVVLLRSADWKAVERQLVALHGPVWEPGPVSDRTLQS